MEIERRVVVPGPPGRAFALVDDLGEYPRWMDLVHEVVEVATTDGLRTWDVELQAQVGPFARSKRLRMVRVVCDQPQEVVFERREIDGRRHSPWTLRATVAPNGAERRGAAPGGDTNAAPEAEVVMTLTYGGSLWSGAVLQRVLDDHVERGADSLRRILRATAD